MILGTFTAVPAGSGSHFQNGLSAVFVVPAAKLPIPLPKNFFSAIQSHLQGFLWQNKLPRIALAKCHWSTFDWGIALPDIHAAHLVVLNEWWFGGSCDPAYTSQYWAMASTTIQHILYGGTVPSHLPPATKRVFVIWKTTLKHIKWEGRITEETPLWEESMLPQMWGWWDSINGIKLAFLGSARWHAILLRHFRTCRKSITCTHPTFSCIYSCPMRWALT